MQLKEWLRQHKSQILKILASFLEKVAAGSSVVGLFPDIIDFKPIFALIIGIISLCLSIYFSVLSDTSETDMSESFLLFCGFLAVVIAAGFYVAHLGKGK